jgi:hypothetical protein
VLLSSLLDRLAGAGLIPSPDDLGTPQHPVDAVFLLDRGVALNLGDGKGQVKVAGPDGEPVSGWVFYESQTVLAEMLLWLYRVMPRFSLTSGSPINKYGSGTKRLSFWRPNPST